MGKLLGKRVCPWSECIFRSLLQFLVIYVTLMTSVMLVTAGDSPVLPWIKWLFARKFFFRVSKDNIFVCLMGVKRRANNLINRLVHTMFRFHMNHLLLGVIFTEVLKWLELWNILKHRLSMKTPYNHAKYQPQTVIIYSDSDFVLMFWYPQPTNHELWGFIAITSACFWLTSSCVGQHCTEWEKSCPCMYANGNKLLWIMSLKVHELSVSSIHEYQLRLSIVMDATPYWYTR